MSLYKNIDGTKEHDIIVDWIKCNVIIVFDTTLNRVKIYANNEKTLDIVSLMDEHTKNNILTKTYKAIDEYGTECQIIHSSSSTTIPEIIWVDYSLYYSKFKNGNYWYKYKVKLLPTNK